MGGKSRCIAVYFSSFTEKPKQCTMYHQKTICMDVTFLVRGWSERRRGGKLLLGIFFIHHNEYLSKLPQILQGVRLDSKSHRKSSQCQNFLTVWHLVVFWADQSKKHCIHCWDIFQKHLLANCVIYYFDHDLDLERAKWKYSFMKG